MDECAKEWPPLLIARDRQPIAGEPIGPHKVDPTLLGTAPYPNSGCDIVTYNRHPLYRYSGDKEPGDTKGQGFNNRWYVIGLDGEPIEK